MNDDAEGEATTEIVDPEMRQLLGMFDVPAFARRGQDLEYALTRLHARLKRDRFEMLEMVRLRLRLWAEAVEGPEAWSSAFCEPIDALWPLAGVVEPPSWGRGKSPATPRCRRSLARDLVASLERFNRRWEGVLSGIDLTPLNGMIDHYNKYYLLEKECVLRSSRLAARYFEPYAPVSRSDLDRAFPPMPVPGLIGSREGRFPRE